MNKFKTFYNNSSLVLVQAEEKNMKIQNCQSASRWLLRLGPTRTFLIINLYIGINHSPGIFVDSRALQ